MGTVTCWKCDGKGVAGIYLPYTCDVCLGTGDSARGSIPVLDKFPKPDPEFEPDPNKSDGGPSSYYDFDPGWRTMNDFMEHKAVHQWEGYALHLKDIGKALCRFGVKAGTTTAYDARKMLYSSTRLLLMIEGKSAARQELAKLLDDPQFQD